MKTLYLLRHAKSSWKDEGVEDIERPLKKRGHFQADLMSDHLSSLIPPPQFVLCSPADRARKTLDYFLEVWPMKKSSIFFAEELYLAQPKTLFKAVKAIKPSSDIAMIVGHNPGLTDFASKLLTSENEDIDTFRTCTFVQIDFDVKNWNEIKKNTGKLKLNLRPKNLEG